MAYFFIDDDHDIGSQTVLIAQAVANARKTIFQVFDDLQNGLAGDMNYGLASG
jgi:hypothetical protein